MTTTPTPPRPATRLRPTEPELVRFDRVERIVHWTTASLFAVLMLTGAALYAGPISTVVGRRDLVRDLHVIAGLALPVPIVVGLVGHVRRMPPAGTKAAAATILPEVTQVQRIECRRMQRGSRS